MSRSRQLALFCITAVTLASTPLAAKLSIGPGGFSRTLAAPLRLTIASAACLIVIGFTTNRRKTEPFIVKREFPWLLGVGATNATAFFLTYFALSRVPSVMLPLTAATQPFMVSFLMYKLHLEEVKGSSVLGCAIAFVGVAILTLHGSRSEHIGALAMLALIAAAVVVSASSVMLKKAKTSSKLGVQLVIYTSTAMLLWCPWLLTGSETLSALRPTMTAVLALLYTALCGSFLGFILYLSVFRLTGAVTASSFALVQPPIALVLSLWLEQASFTLGMGVAFLLVLVGVGLNWRAKYSEQSGHEPTTEKVAS